MATYFHGNSEIQGGGDGLQTLILMNPAYVGYTDNNQQPNQPSNNNFVFLNNSNSSGNNAINLPHGSYSGVPLHGTPTSPPPQDNSTFHGFHPRVNYNLYNQQMDLGTAREVTRAQQGLSLTLSSQQPPGYGSLQSQPTLVTAVSPSRPDDVRVSTASPSSASGVSNGVNGVQSVLLSSKYLKAAQEILEEVVNVGKGVNKAGNNGISPNKSVGEASGGPSGDGPAEGGDGGGSGKSVAELTTAERQEIQMKKAKLVNMLDEVEQRYRQYHHQMQIVISWFEQAAGIGSAKTYTALALQTISKQFRCLKDAILGQIRTASKSLGEDENLVGGKVEGSKLKYVDTQIRQQRALQQLGMIQHNAWRPQRGLPERSVSVLRAWLFEHFLHPYPKDSDKIMLAKQTGLTRSQVSNWFINARVRLWKPMVEEMYTEEMKENERNGSDDNKTITKSEQNEDSTSKSTKSEKNNIAQAIPTSPTESNMRNNSCFNLIASSEIESMTQGNQKKQRNADNMLQHSSMNMDSKAPNEPMTMSFGNERGQSRGDGFTLMGAPTNFIGGFGSYPIGDLGRYESDQFQTPYSGNGVSLTLGLPHCENLSMAGAHQSYMPNNQSIQLGRGVEMGEENDFNGMNNATNTHSNNVYENINIQNRKRFAAQLLPDFVA